MINSAYFQIRLLYVYSFFWMFMLFMPVLIPFLLSHNLSMQEIFGLQAIFGLGVLLLEVPSGYLADVWGRKRTLQLGAVFYGLGYACLATADGWWDFVLFELLLSVAMSMSSGTDVALLYGWIKKQSRESATRMMAYRQMAGVGAESMASLLASLLITGGFAVVMGTQSLIGCLPLLLTLLIREAPGTRPSKDHGKNMRTVLRQIWSESRLLRLIFLNMSFWSLSTFVAVWTFQKYWQDLGVELHYFGLLWAGYNLVVGLSGLWVSRLERHLGPMTVLWLLAILPVCGFLGMGLSGSLLGVVLGLGFQISRGLAQVQLRDAFNWRLPDESYRATANSLASFVFRLGFTIMGPLSGWWIDRFGLSSALIALGIFFALGLPFLVWPLQRAFQAESVREESA